VQRRLTQAHGLPEPWSKAAGGGGASRAGACLSLQNARVCVCVKSARENAQRRRASDRGVALLGRRRDGRLSFAAVDGRLRRRGSRYLLARCHSLAGAGQTLTLAPAEGNQSNSLRSLLRPRPTRPVRISRASRLTTASGRGCGRGRAGCVRRAACRSLRSVALACGECRRHTRAAHSRSDPMLPC